MSITVMWRCFQHGTAFSTETLEHSVCIITVNVAAPSQCAKPDGAYTPATTTNRIFVHTYTLP